MVINAVSLVNCEIQDTGFFLCPSKHCSVMLRLTLELKETWEPIVQ